MDRKKLAMVLLGVLIVSLLVTSVSALQFRPMNQLNHPGLNNRYQPGEDGANHVGVSDYSNVWKGISELCEQDAQLRPANQGLNIIRFFACGCNGGY